MNVGMRILCYADFYKWSSLLLCWRRRALLCSVAERSSQRERAPPPSPMLFDSFYVDNSYVYVQLIVETFGETKYIGVLVA